MVSFVANLIYFNFNHFFQKRNIFCCGVIYAKCTTAYSIKSFAKHLLRLTATTRTTVAAQIYILPSNGLDFFVNIIIFIQLALIRPNCPKILRLIRVSNCNKANALITELYPIINLVFPTVTHIFIKG